MDINYLRKVFAILNLVFPGYWLLVFIRMQSVYREIIKVPEGLFWAGFAVSTVMAIVALLIVLLAWRGKRVLLWYAVEFVLFLLSITLLFLPLNRVIDSLG